MIRYFQIENFKSLRNVGIPFSNLNLLFGMNGMGKSSVMQALLMLRQSYWNNGLRHMEDLHINGELISLGGARDILSQTRTSDLLRFYLGFDGDKYADLKYSYDLGINVSGILPGQFEGSDITADLKENLFGGDFAYLGAEHLGPQTVYSTAQWNMKGMNPFGARGQYAVPFLALNGNHFRVPGELCMEGGKTDRLFDQVSVWMDAISPGVRIGAEYAEHEESARLQISYEGGRLKSDSFSPVNVGFGVPYVLPLIVLLLTAAPGTLILIENPESHLHPRGQERMAELIAKAAAYGCQIICESHSDHIINGIRVAVKRREISENKVYVLYFDKNQEQETCTTEIVLDKKGNLSSVPAGLLDEWGLLMSELAMG